VKKLLTLIFLSLLFIQNANSWEWTRDAFNEWLKKNNIDKRFGCEKPPRPINCWDDNGVPLWEIKQNNLKIKVYNQSLNIPHAANPNYDTLLFYLFRYIYAQPLTRPYYKIEPSNKPYQFKYKLIEDKYINKQMQKTDLLSYLYYEKGKIYFDEITSEDRFGIMFKDDTKYVSNSVGKSLVSYITGHAICDSYIESLETRLNDWPLIENTLYYNQRLIDLLNMRAGDDKFFDTNGAFKKSQKHPSDYTIKNIISSDLLNSKSSGNKYSYNNFIPNIIHNYVYFKSKKNYEKILNTIFNDKAKVKHSIYMMESNDFGNYDRTQDLKKFGHKRYTFFATRYDYLRLAKAMLDDWQNETCVGKYLKNIFENRIVKSGENEKENSKSAYGYGRNYAGQFHTGFPGMKNRPVFAMDGRGNQSIMIDFENERIVTAHAIVGRYNWKEIVYNRIKNGIN
jgi:hypothetical protein